MPDVSVVIPVFNRAGPVVAAIRSALCQDQPPREVIVVDDGSADALDAAVAGFSGSVRLLRHDANLGAATARNSGAHAAACEYIAFLDSDDVWLPGKLRRQSAFLRQHELDAACTGFAMTGGGSSQPRPAQRCYGAQIGLRQMAVGCSVSPGSTLMIRRQVLLDLGGFDAGCLRFEDWDLLLRFLESGHGLGYLPDCLADIRRGRPPPYELVCRSLERLRARHGSLLAGRDAVAARNFQAGLAFERAAACYRRGDIAGIAIHLIRSLALMPLGHPLWRRLLPAGLG